ncbi:alpha/beta hydrolase family protein [Streptomyces katsurahamanus]|uniref:Alpha/beta hydrolase n=1 Tax=Streptomyces katsurahamanus TaxID=2577098 RepID=A0ABW9P367_9ACTN|nr:alpha/beta hydrolase [Streptomyces katsurahamanus]MQS39799.1 alpha/beta hydrolase [Streptomyces katsurahamanus]
MTRLRRSTIAALLALTLPLPLAGAASAAVPSGAPVAAAVSVAAGMELPRPTGPYAVGMTTLPMTDAGRVDHWVPASGARQLMVSLHYPARAGSGAPAKRYMSAEEARLLLERNGAGMTFPAGSAKRLSETRTYAREDARPKGGKFPLVVLSPGFTMSRMTLTLLAEELASKGYVVATVDHAYESLATAFPGRGVLDCVACEKAESGEVPFSTVPKGRSKDVSFVLDELTGPDPAWRYAKTIDRKRIGMAGHSIGGNSASRTMADDRRVKAGINMDGTFFAPVPKKGLDGRPFMMLGAADSVPGSPDASWGKAWKRLDGWKRWITVDGSDHGSFTDAPVLLEQLLGAPQEPALSAERAAGITREYVSAFFDRHLKGIPQRLLNGPTPGNPEVVFHRPAG